ncbi:MAG: hypothetical protein ACTHNM_09885 [Dyella sp.]|uniref:hypothetical protein n=1 Tax=Dyella sp. TaxID=1869338 RepID=UPI003F8199D5
MSATFLNLWFIGLLAATFVPPFWVPQSKRKPLREMLSSAYFGISVAIFLIAYTAHAISVGEVSFGKHQGHAYSLATQPHLFFIMLALNLVLLLCGLACCRAVFKKNLALYVGR